MAGNYRELRRIILEAVSDDYQPFESIVKQLKKETAESGLNFDIKQIKIALLNLIAEDLVGSYKIHAEPPFVTATEATFDTLDRYWFATTEIGEKYRRNSLESCVSYAIN